MAKRQYILQWRYSKCTDKFIVGKRIETNDEINLYMYIYYSQFDKHNFIDFHDVNEPTPSVLDKF